MRFLLCSVTGFAVVLLHSRVSLAQTASEEPAAIEITASSSEAPEVPRWRARAVLDNERAPASDAPSRRVRVAVDQRRVDLEGTGPSVRLIGGGVSLLVATQLFPFLIAAGAGNYSYVFPVVPEVIDGVRFAQSGMFLDPVVAGFEFFAAAAQVAGLAMSIAGCFVREPRSASRESRSIFSWYVAPQVSRSGAGVAVAVMNW